MVTSKLTYTSRCLNVPCHSLNGSEVVQLFRKVGGGGGGAFENPPV